MQATSSSVLHQSLCATPHIVYPLLLTKRNKERRWSCRDAASEPDGPTLPGPGIVSLSVTLVFLSFSTPLVSSAPSFPVSLSVTLFLVHLPQEEMLTLSCSSQWTQCTRQHGHIWLPKGVHRLWLQTIGNQALAVLVIIFHALWKHFYTGFTLHIFPTVHCWWSLSVYLSVAQLGEASSLL